MLSTGKDPRGSSEVCGVDDDLVFRPPIEVWVGIDGEVVLLWRHVIVELAVLAVEAVLETTCGPVIG